MSLILSLLIFSLRFAFSFGNAVEEAFPNFLTENKEWVEVVPENEHFNQITFIEQNHLDAVLEENSEEESENEQLATFIEEIVSHLFKKPNKTALLAGLNSKAKQGNLHLYDLFHSWKDYHLS
jgi:hypothetical protein